MTPAELDELRAQILARSSSSSSARPPVAAWPQGWDELHERNVRIHGAARAELARWTALLRASSTLHELAQQRKERALLAAVEALEEAQRAEVDEARWLRLASWVARRIDEAAGRVSRRSKLVEAFDFFTRSGHTRTAEEDTLAPTDLDGDEIEW